MTEGSTNRVRSIDVMRGFALMCMVLVHFMVYFGDSTAANSPLHVFFNHVLGDWGAACFLMMLGMSQVLSAQQRASDDALLFRRALIRGGYIFLVGILMLALSKGPAAIWRWDILTLMGVATVVLFACRFIPSGPLLLAGALIAVATPPLRAGIDFASLWGGPAVQVAVVSDWLPGILLDPAGEFDIIWKPQEVLRGFLLTGEFPLFPWLLFPPVGFVLGRRIVAGQIRGDLPFLAIIGILLIGLGIGGAYASLLRPGSSFVSDYLAPLSFYPDSFTMILYQLGMSLLVFAGLYFCYDVHGKAPSRVTFLVGLYNRTSRFSLTFYFLHYLLIGWPLMIAAAITGRSAALLGATSSFLAGVAGLLFLETLLYLWEKRGGKYSLEWLLGAITAQLTEDRGR